MSEGFRPDQVEDIKTQKLLCEIQEYLRNNSSKIQRHSAEEYFLMLLREGLKTREAGNYGIAAALVIRHAGVELVVFGRNTVFSENNPHGHAEMNALKTAMKILCGSKRQLGQLIKAGDAIIRKAPHNGTERFLITSLEPCPMCTVGSVINADVKKVVIGTEDQYAGALIKERLAQMAPLWANTAKKQNLEIVVAQSGNPRETSTYLSSKLQDMLNRLFFDTKERLDKKLDEEGFINLAALGKKMRRT